MNRSYLKNLYLQQLESEQYLVVFRESISKLVSLEIINTIISKAVDDTNETALNDILALFLPTVFELFIIYESCIYSNAINPCAHFGILTKMG